ncbi:MAG: hypothetical protein JWP69_1363 [Flaviaesturariibacter sp.]|nr:hypothetical protein [Flaviaesturariibacter sp.]
MTLLQRIKAPTPAFFKKVRMLSLSIAAAGATLLGLPVSLPHQLYQLAGYLVVAGTVAAAVCQTTNGGKRASKKEATNGN